VFSRRSKQPTVKTCKAKCEGYTPEEALLHKALKPSQGLKSAVQQQGRTSTECRCSVCYGANPSASEE
jgi:hypothetical protein